MSISRGLCSHAAKSQLRAESLASVVGTGEGQHHEHQPWAVFARRQKSEARSQHHQHQLRAESLASVVGTGEWPAS